MKRFLSFILSLIMLLSLVPAAAFAASVSVNEMSSVPRKPTMASTAETETETKISFGLVNSIMAQATCTAAA